MEARDDRCAVVGVIGSFGLLSSPEAQVNIEFHTASVWNSDEAREAHVRLRPPFATDIQKAVDGRLFASKQASGEYKLHQSQLTDGLHTNSCCVSRQIRQRHIFHIYDGNC